LDGVGYENIKAGKKYAVIIDGVPYVTTCTQDGEGADAWEYIGNLAAINPEYAGTEYDTGEPFFAGIFGNFTTFVFADGASHKVAICNLNELDEAIINGAGEAFVIRATETGLDKTNAEIYEAFLQNRPIYGVQIGETANSIGYPVVINENYALFVHRNFDHTVFLTYQNGEVFVHEVELGGASPEQIEEAVNKYLDEHPIEGGTTFETNETLTLKNGILSVNTTDQMEQDNTLPITSAGVYATVGNIEALLKTI
jgi:hypothetical protein